MQRRHLRFLPLAICSRLGGRTWSFGRWNADFLVADKRSGFRFAQILPEECTLLFGSRPNSPDGRKGTSVDCYRHLLADRKPSLL